MPDKSQILQLAPLSPDLSNQYLCTREGLNKHKGFEYARTQNLLAQLSKNVWLLLKAANTVFRFGSGLAAESQYHQLAISWRSCHLW